MRSRKDISARFLAAAVAGVLLAVAVPAAAQYDITDLGQSVATQDIQADGTGTVHLVWTNAGVIYYGRVVNKAIVGKVEIGRGINTVYWRPYVSVRPDGSSVHVSWTTTGGHGNKLMHTFKDASGWHTETVLTVPDTQWLSQPACAVDGSGIVHMMFVIWNDTANQWSTIFYMRRLANGNWEPKAMFTPQTPEYKHPMLFTDSTGRVHATWDIAGGTFDAYYCTAPSGGKLDYADAIKIPKRSDNNVSGYGDLYVDRAGVVHRSIGGWSNAQQKMCIDHTKKPVGGAFLTPTRASLGFLNLDGHSDPVPAVVAGEDGRAVVAWGEIGPAGNQVKASFYDPDTRAWSVFVIDPAAGTPDRPNAYRVAMTRTDTAIFGVWRGADGHIQLFTVPISGAALGLTNPNGGETWQAGNDHEVTWTSNDLSGTASLTLYKDGIEVDDIGTATVTAGRLTWSIPRSTPAGTDYRVRIAVGSTVDESNADFAIREANAPNITVSPEALRFGALTTGERTANQDVLLTDSKGGTLHWTARASDSWIKLSATSGTGNALLGIGVNATGLSAGTHSGTVSITDPDAVNSPKSIAVTLEVYAAAAAPVGAFEVPRNGIVVKGTVALTGWALDDLGVTSLEIRRNAVRTDPAEAIGKDGLVLVGTAGFVKGARPDVALSHANYPAADGAAWGFMMDTYALPGGGNGKFVFHAVAYDVEGNRTDLGTRTLTAQDKYNTKPFGLIDAPAWGEPTSGTYANTAWMLTPRPKIIATTGKTIWVYIDGVKKAQPAYNIYREDIALRFPTLKNKGGAGGSYAIDTTRYADGLHTIKWIATDSAGAKGNTGTSYFTVRNVAGVDAAASGAVSAVLLGVAENPMAVPTDHLSPVRSRTGYSDEAAFEPSFPDASGAVALRVPFDGRIELRLEEAGAAGPGARYEGFLLAGGTARPLPAGSTLTADGTFSWQPGPGYFGAYTLVFVRMESGSPALRRTVVLTVEETE